VLALLAIALIAYFAGGYVAGRMSRFDGARQGVGVWVWGIVVAIVLAILGAIAGSEYNLFADLDLPRIPVDEGDLTTGGVILLAVVLIGTLLAAMAGGKAGERYHRRVDEIGDHHAELRDRDRDGDVDSDDRVYEDRPRRSVRDRVTS
jgi:cation transport ATPase